MTGAQKSQKIIFSLFSTFVLAAASNAQWYGPPVTPRSNVDFAYQISFIDPLNAIGTSGAVTTWSLYSAGSGAVDLQIWQPTGSGYLLVGSNAENVTSAGLVTINVPTADQIQVQTGDLVGFRYDEVSYGPRVIEFDFGGGGEVFDAWPDSGGFSVGQTVPYATFSDYGQGRTYSLAAYVQTVPTPAGFATLGLGVLGLACRRTRRTRA